MCAKCPDGYTAGHRNAGKSGIEIMAEQAAAAPGPAAPPVRLVPTADGEKLVRMPDSTPAY